ncbi:MAG: addiction module protein [Bacteroidia bacterium]
MPPQLSEILKLSLPERVLWAETIWSSISAENKLIKTTPLSAKEKKLLDKISVEFEENPHIGSPWHEVKKRITSRKK